MKYLKLFENILNDIASVEHISFKNIILEGGNVFKASSWTRENPLMLTTRILKKNVPSTVAYLTDLTGLPIQQGILGSTGISESSGDIDIAIDQSKISKEELIKILLDKDVQQSDIKKSGDSVHYKCPIQGSQQGEFVQVDFMFVPDVPFAVWSATVTPGSAYKGMYKQQLMADLTRTTNPNWKWNHFKGILDRTTNQSVFGFNPDAIAKALLGKNGKKSDLESVEAILSALKRLKHDREQEVKDAYRQTLSRDANAPKLPDDAITEAAASVGRKYQHIEDLVITNGSLGAMHAIERLSHMAEQGNTIELKWDGMPVVYWGKDPDGTFRMIPKNAWAYLKSGKTQTSSGASTIMNSPKDVQQFILGTGNADAGERATFATEFANLWKYFEQISPKVGYIEGGLLFYPGTKFDGKSALPVYNSTTKTWDFKPNITTFHVPVNSDLGRKIGTVDNSVKLNAKMMVAATGYYPSLGSSDEQRLPNASQLSKSDIIVQGTTYVAEAPKIDANILKKYADAIKTRTALIDEYLAPKPGLKSPANELYTYLNQHLRTDNLVNDFVTWANSNLSEKKKQYLLGDKKGMIATIQTVEDISKIKKHFIDLLSAGTHGGIKQTNPEGYAQAHPGANFKSDLPNQFIKMIDQSVWKPRKLDENTTRIGDSDTAVVGWGRGMGHQGHMYLASAVITTAERIDGDPYFILSRTVGDDDPLLPKEKLNIYQKVFPKYKNIFQIATDQFPTLPAMLSTLKDNGYKNVIVIVGKDQKDAFQFLAKPTKKTGKLPVEFDSIKVISRQETNDKFANIEGPRATPMRLVLTNPDEFRQKYPDEKYNNLSDIDMQKYVWKRDMPSELSDDEIFNLMQTAAERMGHPLAKSVSEADNPNYFTDGNKSAISGTPDSLTSQPSDEEIEKYNKELSDLKRFLNK